MPAKAKPAPAAERPTDFDEGTPPPRVRPRGVPVGAYVVLGPGEDVPALFHEWDREGRIPAGATLCELIGLVPIGRGKASGFVLLAAGAGADLKVKPNRPELTAEQLDGFDVATTVRRQRDPQLRVVFAPAAKGGR